LLKIKFPDKAEKASPFSSGLISALFFIFMPFFFAFHLSRAVRLKNRNKIAAHFSSLKRREATHQKKEILPFQ